MERFTDLDQTEVLIVSCKVGIAEQMITREIMSTFEVMRLVGAPKATILQWMNHPTGKASPFPQPLKVAGALKWWSEIEVHLWWVDNYDRVEIPRFQGPTVTTGWSSFKSAVNNSFPGVEELLDLITLCIRSKDKVTLGFRTIDDAVTYRMKYEGR